MEAPKHSYVRASISFPASNYQNLKTLAKEKKVSLAGVVREAVDRYVALEGPNSKDQRKQVGRFNR